MQDGRQPSVILTALIEPDLSIIHEPAALRQEPGSSRSVLGKAKSKRFTFKRLSPALMLALNVPNPWPTLAM
jgi:hypothetical protein